VLQTLQLRHNDKLLKLQQEKKSLVTKEERTILLTQKHNALCVAGDEFASAQRRAARAAAEPRSLPRKVRAISGRHAFQNR